MDIHDDWFLVSSDLEDKDHPLLLAFTVHGQVITVLATIATTPEFMFHANGESKLVSWIRKLLPTKNRKHSVLCKFRS